MPAVVHAGDLLLPEDGAAEEGVSRAGHGGGPSTTIQFAWADLWHILLRSSTVDPLERLQAKWGRFASRKRVQSRIQSPVSIQSKRKRLSPRHPLPSRQCSCYVLKLRRPWASTNR